MFRHSNCFWNVHSLQSATFQHKKHISVEKYLIHNYPVSIAFHFKIIVRVKL